MVNKKMSNEKRDRDFQELIDDLLRGECEIQYKDIDNDNIRKEKINQCTMDRKEQFLFNVRRGSLAEDIVKEALNPYFTNKHFKISKLSRNYIGDPGKFIEFIAKDPKTGKIIAADVMTASRSNYIKDHCKRGYHNDDEAEKVVLLPITNISDNEFEDAEEFCKKKSNKYDVIRLPLDERYPCKNIECAFTKDYKPLIKRLLEAEDINDLKDLEIDFNK